MTFVRFVGNVIGYFITWSCQQYWRFEGSHINQLKIFLRIQSIFPNRTALTTQHPVKSVSTRLWWMISHYEHWVPGLRSLFPVSLICVAIHFQIIHHWVYGGQRWAELRAKKLLLSPSQTTITWRDPVFQVNTVGSRHKGSFVMCNMGAYYSLASNISFGWRQGGKCAIFTSQ